MANNANNLQNRAYELVYIIQPGLSEEQILNFSQKLAQVVVDQNGEIDVTEMWGKRTLAYPIKRFFEGHYVLQRFYLSPQGTIELERLLRFSEDVIRYLMIRTDE